MHIGFLESSLYCKCSPQSSLLRMHLAGLFHISPARTSLFSSDHEPFSYGFMFTLKLIKIGLFCLCMFSSTQFFIINAPLLISSVVLFFLLCHTILKPSTVQQFPILRNKIEQNSIFLQERLSTTAPCQIDLCPWSTEFCMTWKPSSESFHHSFAGQPHRCRQSGLP